MDYPRFTTEQAATVAGVPANTLSTWLKRGLISSYASGSDVPPDTIAPGTGRGRLFTRRSVLHIAMVARLVRIGLSMEVASYCASTFLDRPDWNSANEEERPAGGFYSEGGTMLMVQWPAKPGPRISVVRKRDLALGFHQSRPDPILTIDMEAFVSSVDHELKQV